MNNELKTVTENKVFFSVKENRNYKVLMTYDREEVIEFAQYKKLMTVLNSAEVLFLTINQRVVNKTTIIDISPTSERTAGQKAEIEKENAEKKKQADFKSGLEKLKTNFDVQFFNARFGMGKWKRYDIKFGKPDSKLVLTEQDLKDSWKAFKKAYPEEASNIEKFKND